MVLIALISHHLYFEFGSGFLFLETPLTQVVVGKNTLSLWLEILREKKIQNLHWFDLTITKRKFTTVSRFLQKMLPVFPKINFGKSNGAGLVTLLCFVMWMDLHIRIPKLEMFRKRTNFNCPNFDILCFRKCVNICLIEEYVRKYVNILYLLKNTFENMKIFCTYWRISAYLLFYYFCHKNVINKLTQGVSIHLF